MDKKSYLCKVSKGGKTLVCDIIGADYAEEALQESVRRHRVKLARAEAASSFGSKKKLTTDAVLFENGDTSFSSELFPKALEDLSNRTFDESYRDEIRDVFRALTNLERRLKKN